MTRDERREKLKDTVDDLVGALLYYDRKEDEEMPRGVIEKMLVDGETTVDEIIKWFGDELRAVSTRKT